MEIWDLYDKNRVIVGEHIRGVEMPPDKYHLVVHIWIKNSENKYLMTQRSEKRLTCPLKWECVGGSVIKGETSMQAALREVKEEVGLEVCEDDCKFLATKIRGMVEGKRINDIVDVYLINYDGAINLSEATTDEVAQVKWMDRNEVEELFGNGEIVQVIKDLSYFREIIEGIFI